MTYENLNHEVKEIAQTIDNLYESWKSQEWNATLEGQLEWMKLRLQMCQVQALARLAEKRW